MSGHMRRARSSFFQPGSKANSGHVKNPSTSRERMKILSSREEISAVRYQNRSSTVTKEAELCLHFHDLLPSPRSLKNAQFSSRSRKARILTSGIPVVFRGLEFESDAEIGQKGAFFKGLNLRSHTLNVCLQFHQSRPGEGCLPESHFKLIVIHLKEFIR